MGMSQTMAPVAPAAMSDEPAERSVVIHLMKNSRAIYELPRLQAIHFNDGRFSRIFDACRLLEQANRPIEPLTLANKMKSEGTLEEVGGMAYLKSLTCLGR